MITDPMSKDILAFKLMDFRGTPLLVAPVFKYAVDTDQIELYTSMILETERRYLYSARRFLQ